MKKKQIERVKDSKVILPAVLLVVGIFFFIIELLGSGKSIKMSIRWISDPLTVKTEKAGRSASEYFSVLTDIPETQKELNNLRLAVLNYESQLAYTAILEEENQSLREEINLGNIAHTYVEAHALGKVEENTMRVSAGEEEGIEIGDTVSVGSSFIGIVMDTSLSTSTVRLPYSQSSALEVLVASKEDTKKTLSRAVVKGSGEEYMIIENISKDAGVNIGDYVFVNDEKVVDTLVLGKIEELDTDPASTSVSGKVVPIVDYWTLISVFICIK